MFIEKALGKIEKLVGGDALESRWYDADLKQFELEKETENVTVVGHGWKWNDGEVVVYRLTDGGWARATVYPFDGSNQAMKAIIGSSEGFETVHREQGVLDVTEEVIGTTEWDITVDVADGVIVEVERDDPACVVG